jgi:photosystem II stability/assembly factor-like uncharacterized protein
MSFRLFLAVACAVVSLGALQAQDVPRHVEKDHFSPLQFDALREYEQAYPAEPGSAAVLRAAAGKYWLYDGLVYQGGTPQGAPWVSLGPLTLQNAGSDVTTSGRVSTLAISPRCTRNGACRLWVGTAGGGVWRSDDALNDTDPKWQWIGKGLGTNSIGTLQLDPNDPSGQTIFVGTGETNTPQNSAAGTGLYRSIDGGDRWARIPTMILDPGVQATPIDFTFTRGIGSVAVVPGPPQSFYVATTTAMLGMTAVRGGQSQITGSPQPRVGLYKTDDDGATWTIAWVPPLEPIVPVNPNETIGVADTMRGVKEVRLDPKDPAIVYASAWNNAIHRSAPSLEGGDASFKPVFAIVGLRQFQDLAMFELTRKNNHTRVYAYNGTADQSAQSLYRLDNADVPAGSLVTGSGAAVQNTGQWINATAGGLTSPSAVGQSICGSQCFYDLVVAVPPDQPDTVVIAGQFNLIGESTLRSTDAGQTWRSLSRDAQNRASHVDVRAAAFVPDDSGTIVVGSDGGLVRTDGKYTSGSVNCGTGQVAALCQAAFTQVPSRLVFMNKGLQTLQFYNIALDPHAPLTRMLGGLQDNSTVWHDTNDPPNLWKFLFNQGDGTSASGFHPTKSNILFASFQSSNFFTNFRSGNNANWVRTADPIVQSGERTLITASTGRQFLSFDAVNPDTQFTGFQHVWRTKDNGGDQAFLEASCAISSASIPSGCGDWVPLGVAFPFPAGSNAASASRAPGDLTSTFYGPDRAGGVIVSAERAASDTGTLWAATNFGRVFVSSNADANGADVTFTRIDTAIMPNRFVTRIVVDRANPNAAYISYSGFTALTPSTPGHIFRAVYNPGTRLASFTNVDADLGDLPVNTIAVDDGRGDVYAGTDFGPIVLRSGSSTWTAAGFGFPEALMVDLEFLPAQRKLVAATHGLGIFALDLDPNLQKE